jgi:hypothetical protein
MKHLHRRLDKIESDAAAPRALALAFVGDVPTVPPAPGATPGEAAPTFADAAALRAWASTLPEGVDVCAVHVVGEPPEIIPPTPHTLTPSHP